MTLSLIFFKILPSSYQFKMQHGKIFMVEMTYSDLELPKLTENDPFFKSCVLLRLFEDIEMEICDNKLATEVNFHDLNDRKCIFSLFNEDEVAAVNASINVFRKDEQDRRVFVGKYDLQLEEILKKLMKGSKKESAIAKSQSKNISAIRSGISSILKDASVINSSLKSLKSESINVENASNTEPVSETIKGLFPLFNHDDENIGFIVLTIRISYYGNVMMHPKTVQVTDEKASTLFFSKKPSNQESTIDFNHLYMYKKSKNEDCECPKCSEISVASKISAFSEESLQKSSSESLSNVPPSSQISIPAEPKEEYDEFVQEINGNAMIIRIAKGAGMKVNVLEPENDNLKSVIGYSRDNDNVTIQIPQNNDGNILNVMQEIASRCQCFQQQLRACPYSRKCARLPIIKGNLKYPNRPPLHMAKIMEPSPKIQTIPDGTPTIDSKTGAISPKGVEISKKILPDTTMDSYVLKLGKKKPGGGHLEIELRTPKSPDSQKSENTVGVQVIEEEFEDYESYKIGKKDENEEKSKEKGKKGKKGKGKKKK
ncbi:uncharacterized protein LOC134828815 [Culicoides brevitarsis]|uniref:uncharacterized protein LOC134828815 n=1 Tax=Culicoides brevitarsis TaxID=469753 RepID=UPI00307C9AB8